MTIRRLVGALLMMVGALLLIFRMPLVYQLVGKSKTKIALFLGIDKLQIFLLVLQVMAVVLIIAGAVIMFLSARQKVTLPPGEKTPSRDAAI